MKNKEDKKEIIENEDTLKHKIKIHEIIIIILAILIILEVIIRIMVYAYFKEQSEFVPSMAAKPIIYIYPEEEQEVTVKVSNPEKFTTTYPKYKDSWQVIASPNGDLIDIKTGRKLYSLYWEGKEAYNSDMTKGFVIKGEDTAKFLEDKLEILGLNEREIEEFIIYWLPKMEHNKYNYVYFQAIEEINNYMELEINPKPETLIRVFMEFKALNKPITIEEESLERVERSGYTVVEWGGTEIN